MRAWTTPFLLSDFDSLPYPEGGYMIIFYFQNNLKGCSNHYLAFLPREFRRISTASWKLAGGGILSNL